jgi:hypothetical protein
VSGKLRKSGGLRTARLQKSNLFQFTWKQLSFNGMRLRDMKPRSNSVKPSQTSQTGFRVEGRGLRPKPKLQRPKSGAGDSHARRRIQIDPSWSNQVQLVNSNQTGFAVEDEGERRNSARWDAGGDGASAPPLPYQSNWIKPDQTNSCFCIFEEQL